VTQNEKIRLKILFDEKILKVQELLTTKEKDMEERVQRLEQIVINKEKYIESRVVRLE